MKQTSTNLSSQGSLSDLRILDLTRVWAGPLGTRTLGDFGAEIIKVSDPRIPFDTNGGTNNKLNRNKQNIGLRLDLEAGRDIFLQLVTISDIVIENFRPRVMRNLNLTFDILQKTNPDLVMCSMPGFGLNGPYSDYPAFGSTAEALSGIVSMIGYEPERPIQTGLSYADPISALNLVGTVIAYARRRHITGRGAHIDLALADSPLPTLGEYFLTNSVTGENPKIQANKHRYYCPHGAYRTKGIDQWIAISITTDKQWEVLRSTINDPRLNPPGLSRAAERKQNEHLIDQVISGWAENLESLDIMEQLQRSAIPAGTVVNNQQLLTNPHLLERGFFVTLFEPEIGPKTYDGQSIPGYMDKSTWEPIHKLGQDNENILVNLLGYSEVDCLKLKEQGIIYSLEMFP